MPDRPRDIATDYGAPPAAAGGAPWASEPWARDPDDGVLRRMGGDFSEFAPRQLLQYFNKRWQEAHGRAPEWGMAPRQVQVVTKFCDHWGRRDSCLIVKTLFDLHGGRWRNSDGAVRPVGWEVLSAPSRWIQQALLFAGDQPTSDTADVGGWDEFRSYFDRDRP